MDRKTSINTIGYACGIGAGNPGCGDGPGALQQKSQKLFTDRFYWQQRLMPYDTSVSQKDALEVIAHISHQVADLTYHNRTNDNPFLVLGGDHSAAVGTWSGAYAGLKRQNKQAELGLIWIDAHLDSHTFNTTPSNNIHGMPLACLLGRGDPQLVHIMAREPKLKPEHICIIGARSYEPEEQALLESLGVTIFYMDHVHQNGVASSLDQAVKQVTAKTSGFGISLDLDAIDPADAPGVGTPEPSGISGQALAAALNTHCRRHPKLIGAEIVEYNPHLDHNQQTEQLISQLGQSIL